METERDRERETETERDRERKTETERETHRETQRERQTERDRQRENTTMNPHIPSPISTLITLGQCFTSISSEHFAFLTRIF
jgi:hypothetical protein